MKEGKREKLVRALIVSASRAQRQIEEVLRRYDLRYTSYTILKELSERPRGITVTEIADVSGMASPDATRLTDRLELLGLLRRSREPGDRRHVTLFITDEGELLLSEVEELFKAACERVTRFVAPTECGELDMHLQNVLLAVEA